MKPIIVPFFIIILVLFSCSDKNEMGPLDGPWIISSKDNVTLHSRPVGYSRKPSPDSASIRHTLNNQLLFINLINQKLNVQFNSGVTIYFYNLDEAELKLGVKGGGSSNMERKEIYYSFSLNQYYPNYQLNDYLGVHEMVHIVSGQTLGLPGTLLMAEGYAVAIDGTLGSTDSSGKTRKLVEDWMQEFRLNNQLVTPSQLLMNFENLPQAQSYAQSGYFIGWLFEKYGVANINQLFISKKENFKTDFSKITGSSFDEMELAYMNDIK